MKAITLLLLLLCSSCCFAAESSNVIAASDWSAPVECDRLLVRGRLLILEGNALNYGGPKTETNSLMFVELQNVTTVHTASAKAYFDMANLRFDFVDTNGLSVPFPKTPGGFAGGARNQTARCWVLLPWNSTVRLFVIAGGKDSIVFHQNGGESESFMNPWSLPFRNTNDLYLSATLTFSSPTNGASLTTTRPNTLIYDDPVDWRGTLKFSNMKIPAQKR